jgi:hypothetical protein
VTLLRSNVTTMRVTVKYVALLFTLYDLAQTLTNMSEQDTALHYAQWMAMIGKDREVC